MTLMSLRRWKLCNLIATIFLVCAASQLLAQQPAPQADQPAASGPVSQWPQRLDGPDGLITIYQPQPSKFEGDTITARAAVSLTPPGATDPEFGAMWFTARVFTDRDARTVTVQNVTIKQVKLPNSAADQEAKFGQVVMQQVPAMNLMLSLDQLESTLGVVQKEKEQAQQFDNTAPKIVFTTTPTTLVLLDGPPKLQETQTQGVMSVINTPFILLLELSSKRYFLKAGDTWMVAPDVTGPWAPAGNDVPAGVADAGNKLSAQNPPANAAAAPPAPAGPTAILVAEEPTELISSQGAPTYTPIAGNDLLYMSNTQSDVFLQIATQQYYVLLSGRWFQGPSLQGPWAFVASDKLPAAFAQIPADSPKANVLASIAGTIQAKDAKMDAFIPQTTAIRRDSGNGLTVAYDGEPQFVPVENTPITYASNCVDPVLYVNNGYYCCHEAVWYRSNVAVGPWAVCDAVPQVIYTLPPSCPVYNCRYVYVYDSTPDVVYCGYLPGYTGCYVYGPTVVYGTGYRYPFWYHTRFIPHPYTWGFAAAYDFHSGTWGLGISFTYGRTWFADRPDHRNWFGPQGFVDYHEVHNRFDNRRVEDRTVVRNATINRINIYNRQENEKRNIVVHNEVRPREEVRTPTPRRALPPAENNVYVGQDGGVYRRTEKGWETHGAKGWSEVKPEVTPRQENREPERVQPTPQRVEPQHVEPQRQEQPARVDPQRGLEEERAARERGAERPNGGGQNVQPHAGGNGGGNEGGGARGGGNGAGGSPGNGNRGR